MRKINASGLAEPGFQIAPMLDVVFVIMLFFMVMAGATKMERELAAKLPGGPLHSGVTLPDADVTIRVEEDGAVSLNGEEFDSPGSKTLPFLGTTLARLAATAGPDGKNLLVTIDAARQARYERIVDVLNALARHQIAHVTFNTSDSELAL